MTTSPTINPLDFPAGYYAIADPDDPAIITLWKRTSRTRQRFTPWQARSRYGPMSKITRADVPSGRAGEAYLQQVRYASMDWYRRQANGEANKRPLTISWKSQMTFAGRPANINLRGTPVALAQFYDGVRAVMEDAQLSCQLVDPDFLCGQNAVRSLAILAV